MQLGSATTSLSFEVLYVSCPCRLPRYLVGIKLEYPQIPAANISTKRANLPEGCLRLPASNLLRCRGATSGGDGGARAIFAEGTRQKTEICG